MPIRKKIATTVYLTVQQIECLEQMRDDTGASIAFYIRRGIDMVIREFEDRYGDLDHTPHADRPNTGRDEE